MILRSRGFIFGTAYMTTVSDAIAGTSVICTQAPPAVILNATLEAELHSARAILGKTFPDLACDPITVS
jgi:hypothetical protein